MGKFNLADAAKAILTEGSKETFQANISAKHGGQDKPAKLPTSVAYGTKDAGKVGDAPEEMKDGNPDYTKGVPTATPPGATPPVGSQGDGVGASKATGPQDHMGRSDLTHQTQHDATSYENIRDRVKYSAPSQTFTKNPGATFQSYGEDVEAMLSGENLSEEFKEKAAMIFEAAVTARANEVIEAAQQDMQEQFEIAVEEIKEELSGKVDDYLNYMVEEWINENEIAITSGLRAEVIESFVVGLHNLFVEHHIDIPEEKVDIVEELADKVTDLEEQINKEINRNVELSKELNEHKKVEAIHAVCEGLTQTQVEKIASLAEGVDFTTESEFTNKLEMIKESYFPSVVKVADSKQFLEESVVEDEQPETAKIADPEMAIYSQTISKTLKK